MLRVLAMICVLDAIALADVADLGKGAPGCDAARPTCLGIALHVTVQDKGPIAAAPWLHEQLTAANRHFERIGVGFQIASIGTLPASAARVEDATERSSFGAHVKGTVIHVFITGQLDDIDVKGGVIRGVAWRRDSTKYVILSTVAPANVLAHELGHVFGLTHSEYAISIMNKTERTDPPVEQRTFADEEYKAMKKKLEALLKAKALAPLKAPR